MTNQEQNLEYEVQFDPLRVRALATAVGGLVEIKYDVEASLISFRHEETGARINVYYTTGTVGTALDHHRQGKNQLFRRKVDIRGLFELFLNPRAHTNKGYRKRADAAKRERKAVAKRAAAEEKAKREAAEAKRMEQENAARRHARGEKFVAYIMDPADAKLFSGFANEHTASFALDSDGSGGVFVIYDSGKFNYGGAIPRQLYNVLEDRSQESAALEYIVLGTCNRFFVRFADGQTYWGGLTDDDFDDQLELIQTGVLSVAFGSSGESGIRSVAFGSSVESWVIVHDGDAIIGDKTPIGLRHSARFGHFGGNISTVTMGPEDQYFLRHKNGSYEVNFGRMQNPGRLRDAIAAIEGEFSPLGLPGSRVQEIQFGADDSWAIRYVK